MSIENAGSRDKSKPRQNEKSLPKPRMILFTEAYKDY